MRVLLEFRYQFRPMSVQFRYRFGSARIETRYQSLSLRLSRHVRRNNRQRVNFSKITLHGFTPPGNLCAQGPVGCSIPRPNRPYRVDVLRNSNTMTRSLSHDFWKKRSASNRIYLMWFVPFDSFRFTAFDFLSSVGFHSLDRVPGWKGWIIS